MEYMALLGLAAFDGGLIGWLFFASHGAKGTGQRALAYVMIGVDLIGVIILTIVDMTMVSQQNGLIQVQGDSAMFGMIGAVAVIIANVVAGVIAHIVEPEHLRKFQMENIRDQIRTLEMKHMKQASIEIMPEIAKAAARQYVVSTLQTSVKALPSRAANASSDHYVDPYGVKEEVDDQYRLDKDVDPFGELAEEDDYVEINPESGPETWTLEQWTACAREMNAFDFDEMWWRYHEEGDTYPWSYEPKKKRGRPKKKAKQVVKETE